jgi:hypothetical protein
VPQAGAVLRDGRVIQRGRHAELTELDAQVRRALHPPGSPIRLSAGEAAGHAGLAGHPLRSTGT